MVLRHTIPLALLGVLGFSAAGLAQMPPAGPAQQAPPCFNEFVPLREEVEKRGMAIKGAADRKAPRQEVCQLFRRLVEAEQKVVKFFEANQSWCGIPPQMVEAQKTNHGKTVATRDRVCSAAPIGVAPKPVGPSLSDTLTSPVPSGTNTRTGRGTLDSLSGNPLAR